MQGRPQGKFEKAIDDRIICNTIVSVVVQHLIYHQFLDTENPFDFLHFEALYISEIRDSVLEIARDRTTRHCSDERGRKELGYLSLKWYLLSFFQNFAIPYRSENSCIEWIHRQLVNMWETPGEQTLTGTFRQLSDTVMGPFLNNHYWPATAFPQVNVALTFRLDVNDSCPAKLHRRAASYYFCYIIFVLISFHSRGE